ncbi:MAG TPA: hypothetical protein VJ774_00195 [Actinomycetota bacterium]|nr:hypothetical protein [Actinomycetota bacterium]
MGARPTWFYRHAVVTVITCSLLGGSLGIAFAAASLPEFAFQPSEILRPIGFVAVSGAGVMIGVLAGVLLVRTGRSGLECPRCGTLNDEGTPECLACGLSLT